ncbi:MAG: hypothetical protein Tsb0020_01180 [Haliangiales bacterium]
MEAKGWVRIADDDAVRVGAPRTVRVDKHQIVVFRLPSGSLHAIDNRCPHEGYPLSTGRVEGDVLTCEWHNWKFRLCDGACVLGGEDVRRYPIEVRDGGVWIDVTEPPGEERQPALFKGLLGAFEENDWGQAGRTIVRLRESDASAAAIIGFGCDYAAERALYGFDHGLAVSADIAASLDDFDDTPSLPILEALSLMVEPNLRRPVREVGDPISLTGTNTGTDASADASALSDDDWQAIEDRLRAHIEAEELAQAEGLLRGALAAGAGPRQVFRWLTHAATDHFLGYGHAHIYCVKAEELLDFIGWQHADPVLTSLVAEIVYDTREDRLPYMRSFGRAMEAYQGHFATWQVQPQTSAAPDVDAVLAAVLDGSLEDALASVAAELDRGVAPDRVALVLGLAAAERLLRFNASLEHRDDISEGWLSVTHLLTHADAVRESLLRRPSADTLRGLFHSARFIQHSHPCDLPAAERVSRPASDPAAADAHASASDASAPLSDAARALIDAVRTQAGDAAVAAYQPGMARDAALGRALRRHVISDSANIPIFADHHIKTTLAAQRLTAALYADPLWAERAEHRERHIERELPLLATIRFVAHPLRERRVARQALVAEDFVSRGATQTRLRGY